MVSGFVVVVSKNHISHNGISLLVDGMVQLQMSSKNTGAFEAFYNSVKPITMMNLLIEAAKPGKLPDGETKIPFEFKLEAAPGLELFETYHGVFINVSFVIKVSSGLLLSPLLFFLSALSILLSSFPSLPSSFIHSFLSLPFPPFPSLSPSSSLPSPLSMLFLLHSSCETLHLIFSSSCLLIFLSSHLLTFSSSFVRPSPIPFFSLASTSHFLHNLLSDADFLDCLIHTRHCRSALPCRSIYPSQHSLVRSLHILCAPSLPLVLPASFRRASHITHQASHITHQASSNKQLLLLFAAMPICKSPWSGNSVT